MEPWDTLFCVWLGVKIALLAGWVGVAAMLCAWVRDTRRQSEKFRREAEEGRRLRDEINRRRYTG